DSQPSVSSFPGLINSHRNIHGDAPRPLPAAPPRWNNPRSAAYGQRGAFSRNFQAPRNFHPRQTHSWRKKYSLDNRLPGSASEVGSASGTSRVFGSYGDNPAPEPPESSPERHVDFTTDGNIVVGIQVPQRAGDVGASGEFSGREAAVAPSGDGKSIPESPYPEERRPSLSISFSSTSRTVCLPGSVAGSSFSPSGSGSESAVTLKSEPQEPLEFPGQEPAGNSGRIKAEPPSPGQSCEEVKDASLLPKLFGNAKDASLLPKLFGNAKDASLLPKLFGNAKVPSPPAQLGVIPGKSRFPVIPKSPVSSKAPKFRKNNYTWVANPGKSCRLVRRWGSPRAENSRKGLGGTERGAKTSPRADLGAKAKKSGLQSKLGGVSPNKYKWKASSLPALPSTSKSAFRWRSEDHRKPPDIPCPGSAPVAPSAASVGLGAGKSFGEALLSSYKVKSRTKIIKRKGNVGSLLPKLFGNAKDASLLPKLFGNAKVPSPPAQLGVIPGKSRFPVIPKSPVSSKAPKFRKNNYTWVANPGKSCRLVRRWGSPRAENSRKGLGGTERGAKTSPRADLGAKAKKSGLQSKLGGVSPNKYKWKASSLPALPSTSKSAFRWRSEDHRKPPDIPCPGSAPVAPSAASVGLGAGKSFGEALLSSYKVKSRTKIIKRKGNVGFPTEKKNVSPGAALKSRFHLRRKNSARGKPSATPKRSSPRILVQVSRHRLRRIPAARNPQGATKEGSNFPLARNPPSNKVIKTRYRIVKKNVTTPASSSFSNPIPTWKARRPMTSRSLLLNQTRPSPQGAKSQPAPPRWRSKGFRCIGGVLYRVSANKLSKTSSTPVRSRDLGTKTPSRAALRLHSMPSPGISPSGLNRSSSCRYIASGSSWENFRLQTSFGILGSVLCLSLLLQGFGRSHLELLPVLHPESWSHGTALSLCCNSRFLRGTCKKTDGTCPFSHKVSKDKMPVCSYYLKGICSNSNCPYSHVYVSRKAEVCQDFLKGYCPMGEKCKKKHTLVCPDFARNGVCPKGGRCKLLHPRKRRHPKEAGGDGDQADPPSKWRWVKEEPDRNDPAQLHDDGEIPGPSSAEQEGKFGKEEDSKPTSCLQKLPSFISLRSPEYPRFRGCEVEKEEDEPEEKPGTTKRKRILPRESSEDSEDTRVEGARGKRLQIKPRL
ncbi:PREDICTED: zinc finger CCCH domain-containing protein 3, partial [Lepidothrix coronata]|uniref:Zinc finger CCCH domain-containing protein 3 n=1 Tax=Lepidothrix coronata TaxID=321398 RepID=A0A6J0J3U4_9PASS